MKIYGINLKKNLFGILNKYYSKPFPQDVPARPFVTTFWERNLPSVGGFLTFMGVSSFLALATAAGVVAYKKGLLPHS